MDSVSKTLYIPLRGKAWVSSRGIILHDPKAEQIWAAEAFPLKGKSGSRWLACYMGMRAAVFDRWLRQELEDDPTAVVLHIGCGMDSRCERLDARGHSWFDIDFPHVIRERRRYYRETGHYQMLAADIRSADWLQALPGGNAVVVMEGVSMYLSPEELKQVMDRLGAHFDRLRLLMDCYTTLAARASRYKNPINDVGVTEVYGLDDPNALEGFVRQHDMTPAELVDELRGLERGIFKALYAGGAAKKLYRLYEYRRC